MDGKAPATEMKNAAKEEGIGERTLNTAAEKLGVIKKSTGFGKKKKSHWMLSESSR